MFFFLCTYRREGRHIWVRGNRSRRLSIRAGAMWVLLPRTWCVYVYMMSLCVWVMFLREWVMYLCEWVMFLCGWVASDEMLALGLRYCLAPGVCVCESCLCVYESCLYVNDSCLYVYVSRLYVCESCLCVYGSCLYVNASLSDTRMALCGTHCNTLQHTVTHCNTLQHTATHCNTLQVTEAKMKSDFTFTHTLTGEAAGRQM